MSVVRRLFYNTWVPEENDGCCLLSLVSLSYV